MQQNLVNTAARLNGSGDRQRMIAFDEPATSGRSLSPHCLVRAVSRNQGRFEDAATRFEFWEEFHQKCCESLQVLLRFHHVAQAQRRRRASDLDRLPTVVTPQEGPLAPQRPLDRSWQSNVG